MHSEQGTVAKEQDNLGIIIECLTPRVSITALSSSSTPSVRLASIWRFFDSPYGHPVLFPTANGGVYRTYWTPVLSKIELYPIQRQSLTISSTAPKSSPDLPLNPLVYEDRRPVAERQPFIEMIKSLARTNPVIQEGSITDIDYKSWFSVIWSQISVDPRHIDLQRDHLLIFYKFNTPQTVSWLTKARRSDHDHHLEMYINYNRFYTEKRSPSNKQLRFSPPESWSTTSPLRLLNLSHDDLQHELDTYDCTYSLLTVHSPMLPTCTSDLSWARNGFQPERLFSSPGIINSLKTYRSNKEKGSWNNLVKSAAFEDTNTLPHTMSVFSKSNDYKYLQQDQVVEKRIGVEFLRVKDALCIHHLCRESAPSAENILDVFNYFIEHLPICNNLQIKHTAIVLKGNISKRNYESSALSWCEQRGYLNSEPQSSHLHTSHFEAGHKHFGQGRCRISADEVRRIFSKNSYSLSEYPRTIIHLYVILLLMQQHSEVYKDVPLYYRIVINALYYTTLQQILHKSKTISTTNTTTVTSSSSSSRKDSILTISMKNDNHSQGSEVDKRDTGKDVVSNANETIPINNSSCKTHLESASQPKTIAGLNYSINLLPPYNIHSFVPEYTSRISSILDGLTLQQLHSTLCDLLKNFYLTNTSCIEKAFGKTKTTPNSFKYLSDIGFPSIMNVSSPIQNNNDPYHTYTTQVILSHPVFKRSSYESKKVTQTILCQRQVSSQPTPTIHKSPNIVITTMKTQGLENQSDGSSDSIPVVSDTLVSNKPLTIKHTFLASTPHIPSTASIINDKSDTTYISLLLEHGKQQCFSSETKLSKNKIKCRDSKKKELSITVGTSLPPGDKEKYEKIILDQYKIFIKSLYQLLMHKQPDKVSESSSLYSSSHVSYLTFYRRAPCSDCSCSFCYRSLTMENSSNLSLECDRCSTTPHSSLYSKANYDSPLCGPITKKLMCSPTIRRYISADKTLARFIHFSANYKLTEFSNLSSVATKFLSSRSIMDGIRLSFIGCLPLNTFHNNLEFYRSTDNSENNFRLIRSKDATHTLKFSEYPVIYHVFLEIILNYVASYYDLAPCMPPKLEKFILKPMAVSKTMAFTDTIDDSAITFRGGNDLEIHISKQRPSSAEGGNRERGRKQRNPNLKNQRIGHGNQSSNRGSTVKNSK